MIVVVGPDTTAPPASDMLGDMGAAAGADAVAHDAPMRETSARRAATPRGRALPRTAVSAGGAPLAKRPTARVVAEVPPAPGREMTMLEVTHTLQHLMAQATRDTTQITATQTVPEEHAKQIDENAAKSRMLNQVGQARKADIKKAFTTVEQNDVKIKSVCWVCRQP